MRQSSESNFSVLDVSWSILPILEQTNGVPDVCVGLMGFDTPDAQSAALAQLGARIEDAANQWNALLGDDDAWRITKIAPTYRVHATPCTSSFSGGFSVNLWKDVERFKTEFCAKNGMAPQNCCSATFPWSHTLNLGPWNRTREVDPFDPFASLHEYGHLLGLGDTYEIPGRLEWEGEQPPAVMNGNSHVPTEDDALGVLATLHAVRTGVRSCEGTAKVTLTKNAFGALMCNPAAVPVTLHPGRPTGPTP